MLIPNGVQPLSFSADVFNLFCGHVQTKFPEVGLDLEPKSFFESVEKLDGVLERQLRRRRRRLRRLDHRQTLARRGSCFGKLS